MGQKLGSNSLVAKTSHKPNKGGSSPSCICIKCTKASSWCSKGSPSSALVATCTTNPFNASFNALTLDLVIGPFGMCNGSLVFVGYSKSKLIGN